MAVQPQEVLHPIETGVFEADSDATAAVNGLAQVLEFPSETQSTVPEVTDAPGMATTLAFVGWIAAQNTGRHAKFSVVEFLHDEDGLHIETHGNKVYLA